MRRPAAVALVSALVLAGCSPKTLVVPEDDSGSAVTIEPGQELRIELAENASVGWTWELTTEPDPEVLRFVDTLYEPDDPGSDGGGGTRTYRFKGTGPGRAGLEISRDYRGEGIDKTFELSVTVESP